MEKKKRRKTEGCAIGVVQRVSTVCHNSSARMASPWSKSLQDKVKENRRVNGRLKDS